MLEQSDLLATDLTGRFPTISSWGYNYIIVCPYRANTTGMLYKVQQGHQLLRKNAFAMATKPDIAMYYHRAAFSPVPNTFISAINNGNFSTWPGLTA